MCLKSFENFIKFSSLSNSSFAALELVCIVLYHAVCEDTPSSETNLLNSLILSKSFDVIKDDKEFPTPFIPPTL